MKITSLFGLIFLTVTILGQGCSGGGSAAWTQVSDTQDTILRTQNGVFVIPAGTLSSGIGVRMSEGGVNYTGTGTAISNVFTIEFDQVEIAALDGMTLTVDVSRVVRAGSGTASSSSASQELLVIMSKITGDHISEDGDVTSWFSALGNLDATSGTYEIRQYATAERIDLVLVRRSDMELWVLENTDGVSGNASAPASPSTAKAAEASAWTSYPWLVIVNPPCDACTSDNLARLKDDMAYASERLYANGFTSMRLSMVTDPRIEVTGNALAGTSSDQLYHQSYVDRSKFQDYPYSKAFYDPHSAALYWRDTTLETSDSLNLRRLSAHELTHAAQQSIGLRNIYRYYGRGRDVKWLIEGTADFSAYSAIGIDISSRAPDAYRDFSKPLYLEGFRYGDGRASEYLMAPYWSWAAGADASRLPGFFTSISDVDAGASENPYLLYSDLFAATFGDDIGSIYVHGIAQHLSRDSGYPYCTSQTVSVGASTSVVDSAPPMSSKCYSLVPTTSEYNKIWVTATANTADTRFALVMNGSIAAFQTDTTPAWFLLPAYQPLTVWVANLNLDPYDEGSVGRYELGIQLIEDETLPEPRVCCSNSGLEIASSCWQGEKTACCYHELRTLVRYAACDCCNDIGCHCWGLLVTEGAEGWGPLDLVTDTWGNCSSLESRMRTFVGTSGIEIEDVSSLTDPAGPCTLACSTGFFVVENTFYYCDGEPVF